MLAPTPPREGCCPHIISRLPWSAPPEPKSTPPFRVSYARTPLGPTSTHGSLAVRPITLGRPWPPAGSTILYAARYRL